MKELLTTTIGLVILLGGLAACAEPSTTDTGSSAGGSAPVQSPTTEPEASPSEQPAEEPDNLVAATQFRFNTDEIILDAGEPTKLPFVNNDSAPHNISIYVSKGSKLLFEGKKVDGGGRTEYKIPAMKKGRYYFLCDIHPVMEGDVVSR